MNLSAPRMARTPARRSVRIRSDQAASSGQADQVHDRCNAAEADRRGSDGSSVATPRPPCGDFTEDVPDAEPRRVPSFDSDFNYDFNVSVDPEDLARDEAWCNYAMRPVVSDEMSGVSIFARNAAGEVFHPYSTFARGCERLLGACDYFDMSPSGRNETIAGNLTDWVRHHDRYGSATSADACCQAPDAA